jgi:hypothetical protein
METLYLAVIDWLKTIVTFGLGVVVGIIVRRYEINWLRPRINIQDVVVTKRFHLKDTNE